MRATAWVRSLFFACLLAAGDRAAMAQGQPMPRELNDDAVIEEVQPNMLVVRSSKSELWCVQIAPGQTKTTLEGAAEPNYLHTGLYVSFSGAVDAKGKLEGEISSLDIFTPQGKSDSGLFPAGAGADAKPVAKLAAGSYDIKGRVTTFKDGELNVVAAGKKISGKVSPSAQVKVSMNDLSLAQQGDAVKVKAHYFDQDRPVAAEQKPGNASGEELVVTMAKPLEATKKGKAAAKPLKTARGKSAPGEAPFGQGGAGFGENAGGFGNGAAGNGAAGNGFGNNK